MDTPLLHNKDKMEKLLHALALPTSLAAFPDLFPCCAILGNLLNIFGP